MGDKKDKNSKKKKSKKTPRAGFTHLQIANEELDNLGDSEQTWLLAGKPLPKINKETKGKGYHTEGEKPQKKRKTRSTSDNEDNPMDTPTDMAMHNQDAHLIHLSALSIHPTGSISHHQPEELNINPDEPGTSHTPFRIDPTQSRYGLRSQITIPAQMPNKPVEKLESQHKANYETTIAGIQALSYKVQIEDEERPISEDDCISSSEDDTGDEKTNHREENPNLEELGQEHFEPPHHASIQEKSWTPVRTPLNKSLRQPPRTSPTCPPTQPRPLKPRHKLPRLKESPSHFKTHKCSRKFCFTPRTTKKTETPNFIQRSTKAKETHRTISGTPKEAEKSYTTPNPIKAES
jgi:hypothetical protein